MPLQGPDDQATQCQYTAVSGFTLDDCCFLGLRTPFESPFSPFQLESWPIYADTEKLRYFYGTSNWLTALWRVPGGPLYVGDNSAGNVQRLKSMADGKNPHAWETLKVDLQPLGLFAFPDGALYVNPAVEPALATAGSGDVLTGVITALLSQGMAPLAAAWAGVFLHGRAGAYAATVHGAPGVIADDLPDAVAAVRASWSAADATGGEAS